MTTMQYRHFAIANEASGLVAKVIRHSSTALQSKQPAYVLGDVNKTQCLRHQRNFNCRVSTLYAQQRTREIEIIRALSRCILKIFSTPVHRVRWMDVYNDNMSSVHLT